MNYDTMAEILSVVTGWWLLHRQIVLLRERRERMVKLEGAIKVMKDMFQASDTGKQP